jgi:sugar diacid utilization regulator
VLIWIYHCNDYQSLQRNIHINTHIYRLERNITELTHIVATSPKAKGIPPSMNHPLEGRGKCMNIRFDPSQETQD